MSSPLEARLKGLSLKLCEKCGLGLQSLWERRAREIHSLDLVRSSANEHLRLYLKGNLPHGLLFLVKLSELFEVSIDELQQKVELDGLQCDVIIKPRSKTL